MKIKFWGTRGTYPVPGETTKRYGGNTSCVEVRASDGTLLILDAGTGIRPLGQKLFKEDFACGKGEAHILLSHTHWDHLQGFPFCGPVFVGGNRFHIYAPRNDAHLRSVFLDLTAEPYFPVPLDKMSATFSFHDIHPGESFSCGGVRVKSVRLNHPWCALGYRLEEGGASLAYFPDTAPFEEVIMADAGGAGARDPALLEEGARGLRRAAKGVDLLIYDATLSDAEYEACRHTGHSTPRQGLALAREAGANRLVLFHHAPERTDEEIDAVVEALAREAGDIHVEGAYEGWEIAL